MTRNGLAYLKSRERDGGMTGAAYHEAGHAVVAGALKLDPGTVVLYRLFTDPASPWLRGRHESGDHPEPGDTAERTERHVLVFFAGGVAEAEWINRFISLADRTLSEHYAREGAGRDERRARDLLQSALVQDHEAELRGRAERLVRENWEKIELVAQALVGLEVGTRLPVRPLLTRR